MNQTANQIKPELVRACADLEANPDFFRELFESIPEILKVETIPKTDQANFIPSSARAVRSAIFLSLRHSDYETLLKRGVNPALTLVRKMGLRVQGPVFLPSSKMRRSAILLVSGSAETLIRYTKQISSLTRYGVKLDIKLERHERAVSE